MHFKDSNVGKSGNRNAVKTHFMRVLGFQGNIYSKKMKKKGFILCSMNPFSYFCKRFMHLSITEIYILRLIGGGIIHKLLCGLDVIKYKTIGFIHL